MVKVLIALTSYNKPFYPDGTNTGVFVTEALHPFQTFKAKDYDVDFVSETGTFGFDEHSKAEDFLNGDDLAVFLDKHSEFNITLSKTKKAASVDASQYHLIFFSAGHGSVFDYPLAKNLQRIAGEIWGNGGVVAAVCHGPAIFAGLNDLATGKPMIEGKKITGFTDVGEEQLGLAEVFKDEKLDTIEEMAAKYGAHYEAPPTPWEDFTVVDGKLVTGVNPASAHSTAAKAIKALS